ncbi:HAD family hydrolase [Blastococcus sp. TML/C7B]|uniref:HAD family hydrolase n=1 Tax=Blastococcus sp. TML/C7B TaxID=2798728 RepID=UPI0021030FC5|nr:HAD hydrolase family protein [Blastococcus sp. TML/C7B]
MSDWRPRLIASDMDGTLLRSDDTVGDATVAELARWRAEGVPFVLATGRPPRWMHRVREVIEFGTAVCCNGAVLLDLGPMKIVDEAPLTPDALQAITAELRVRQPTRRGSPSSTAGSSATSRSTARAGTSTRPASASPRWRR